MGRVAAVGTSPGGHGGREGMQVRSGVHGDAGATSGARGSARRRARRRARRWAGPLAVLTSVVLVTAGCTDDPGPQPAPEPTTPATSSPKGPPSRLTFGVFGPRDEIDAFRGVVDVYNSTSDDSTVTLRTWPSHDALLGDLKDGAKVPDVFLASRSDLAWLREQKITQPVDDLLDERGVDFGDDYSRDALEAYSVDNRLQCMPYGISPMVIYYNKQLVNFAQDAQARDRRAGRRGRHGALDLRPVRERRRLRDPAGQALARGVRRPHAARPRAVHLLRRRLPLRRPVEPDLAGALRRGQSRRPRADAAAAARPAASRSPRSSSSRPPRWSGSSAAGSAWSRASARWCPSCGGCAGLEFDVMPMPVLDSYATVGDITGLCLSSRAASTPEAADFLVHATSTSSVDPGGPGRVAGAGQPRGRAVRRLPADGPPARRTRRSSTPPCARW